MKRVVSIDGGKSGPKFVKKVTFQGETLLYIEDFDGNYGILTTLDGIKKKASADNNDVFAKMPLFVILDGRVSKAATTIDMILGRPIQYVGAKDEITEIEDLTDEYLTTEEVAE